MKRLKNDSLIFQITIWAVLAIAVFSLVSAIVDYRLNAKLWREALEEQTSQLSNFITLSLPAALWNYDQETIDGVLNAIVESNVIDAIYIVELGDQFKQGVMKHEGSDVQIAEELPDTTGMHNLPLTYVEADNDVIANVFMKMNYDYLDRKLATMVNIAITRTFIVVAILTIVIYILLKLLVSKPISQLNFAMLDIATGEGDLTKRLSIRQNNEIGELVDYFNQFINKLQDSMSAVGEASIQGQAVVKEMEASFAISRSLVSEQGNEIESIATAITESSAAAQEIASSAKTTSAAAAEAHTSARSTQAAMESTVQLIQSLDETMEKTSVSMANLQADVDSITEIMSVIHGIAEQTNLLALNAAIEAARAGEQGRGFAVVADEVRSLAARTQVSTKEISAKIDRLKASTSEGMELFKQGNESSKQGVEQIEQAKASLNVVFDALGQINDMSTHIASAANEQSCVSQELSENTQRLSGLSQQANEQVDKAGVLSQDAYQQSEKLGEQLAGFKW
ncbi:MAG: methyl-accepting chemotaxis protein [Reinekea sp.]